MNNKTNYQTLIAQINQQVEELAKATDEARMSEAMLRYLDAFSRFHRYSLYNTWLILMSRPDATHVAGFRQWNSYNRFVRKGECGIPILAPIWVKQEADRKRTGQAGTARIPYCACVRCPADRGPGLTGAAGLEEAGK